MVSFIAKYCLRRLTYELDDAMGSSLVTLLAVEQETLASLGSPGGHMVGDLRNLVGLERGDRLQVNWLRTEPKELLGVDKVPYDALV
jgi:hypothetical protein